MSEVKVWRKKIGEAKTRIYYATTNGNFYYINKRTNEKNYIKPSMMQGRLIISLGGGRKEVAKNLMAKTWLGAKHHDVVEQINGDIYDFRLENLRVIAKEEKIKETLVKYQKERSKRLKEVQV